MDCSVREIVPDNYSPDYEASIIEGLAESVYDDDAGCYYENVDHGEFLCEITNTPNSVDVEIEKLWIIDGADNYTIDTNYQLTLYCDSEILNADPYCEGQIDKDTGRALVADDGIWCRTFQDNISNSFLAEVVPDYPYSHCWVVETVYDDAIHIDNGCDDIKVSASGGDEYCRIINTYYFEGIPTLNHLGLAIMALLMLGVGLVGFRRFV